MLNVELKQGYDALMVHFNFHSLFSRTQWLSTNLHAKNLSVIVKVTLN